MRQTLLEVAALQELLRVMRYWSARLGEQSEVGRAFATQEPHAMACLRDRLEMETV